jgi:septum formation protein
MAGFKFEVIPSDYPEPLHSSVLCDPAEFAMQLALQKGKEVFSRPGKASLVLSADTIGLLGHEVLEKPVDRNDARRMLKLLSGKTHQVITAIAIYIPGVADPKRALVTTDVTFHHLSEEEIEQYLDTGEYTDKAAAYAIQGRACVFVARIDGDYFNVVGLPIATVWAMLKDYFEIAV